MGLFGCGESGRGTPMPAEFYELADYNGRVSKGIAHAPEYAAKMAELQERFWAWSDADLASRGFIRIAGQPHAWVKYGGYDEAGTS